VPIQLLITALGGLTAAEFSEKFRTEEACKSYLVALRWPDGVCCPRCGNPKVYRLTSEERQWQCEECSQDGYRFSHLVGTFFKNTNKPLLTWFRVIQLIAKEPEISAVRIRREFGFGSYKTAWKMRNRIRAAPSISLELLELIDAALADPDSEGAGASLTDSADQGNQDI
jgi:ribosomal protein L37AE/L43A